MYAARMPIYNRKLTITAKQVSNINNILFNQFTVRHITNIYLQEKNYNHDGKSVKLVANYAVKLKFDVYIYINLLLFTKKCVGTHITRIFLL